jgi:branched-chain amino acid transport system substrate-binding protein
MGVFATPWAGEAISMLRTALWMGGFAQIQAWWQAMGGSVDVLEGISGQLDQFDDKLWATARYLFTYSPDETKDLNDAFLAAFQEKFNRLPNYSAECTYSAIKSYAQAAEDAGSTDTADVIEALEGMEIATPAGMRTYRPEDHQAVYAVPGGRSSAPTTGRSRWSAPTSPSSPRGLLPLAALRADRLNENRSKDVGRPILPTPHRYPRG